MTEFISFHAIDASADLARERGSYPNFQGSGWSQGLVPIDTIARLQEDRGVPVAVDRTTRMDWDTLRTKVAGGIRNATLMAIAPTASIGLVAGTTPGLDPQFSQIFSRATSSGKFLEVNRNLVRDLQALGLWEQVRDDLLAAQGDLSQIPGIPERLVEVYRTSFQLSPFAFVEVAARAQKWVDQAISRNIYLASRDVGEMAALYQAAWERGVKTTYYLHMKPRHTAEQSTVRVNKAEARPTAAAVGAAASSSGPRRGFGFGKAGAAPAEARPTTPTAGPAPTTSVAGSAPTPTRRGFGFGAATAPAAASPAGVEAPAVPAAPAVPSAPSVPAALAVPAAPSVPAALAVPETPAVPEAPAVPAGVSLIALDDATDVVGGVACPVDPMERLQCESCQ